MTGAGVRGHRALLVVEDSDDDFEAAIRALRRAGHGDPVARCTTGEAALDYLLGRGTFAAQPPPRPDLVLLDLNLPGTDGREVLAAVKSSASHRTIPIIVLSTSALASDVSDCYRAGANAYMQKPATPRDFNEAIGRMKDFWFDIAALPAGGGP